ncbi:hypothetical protein [Aquimarina megaterium]|uniref:hypothetical protein n=1 Tax=Aquimarina megaterium TaxID=1443666 RepID=UPI00046F5157|nr:hypothetical protein [Aquimarina megaterium]
MQNKVRSFNQFKTVLEKDATLQQEFKSDPVAAIKKFKSEPWFNDKLIYRLVVLFLGIIVLTICVGVIILTSQEKINENFDVPDILIATASTAIGAIAGLLTPGSNKNPGTS